MKATELMIDNWVRVRIQGKEQNAVVQIIDGYTDEPEGGECVCNGIYFQLENVYPIPLSREILESNGFELRCAVIGVGECYRCIHNNINIGVLIKKIGGDNRMSFNGIDLFTVNYVHQLQNALNIMNTNKIIVL